MHIYVSVKEGIERNRVDKPTVVCVCVVIGNVVSQRIVHGNSSTQQSGGVFDQAWGVGNVSKGRKREARYVTN